MPRRSELHQSDHIRKYLLNDRLEKRVTDAIARSLHSDRSFVEEVRAIEDELMVQYVTNQLDSRERSLFRRFVLTSPEKKRQHRFIQLLITTLVTPVAGNSALHAHRSRRVFLSSTQADLEDERSTALDVITRLQMRHGSMEFFGARQDYPLDTCLKEVQRSDIVVLLVGYRYGSISKKTGKSFTESEYREAFRFGKECLVYFRDDQSRILPGQTEQDPRGLELLQTFKALLLKRHTISKFADSNHLAAILAADLASKLFIEYKESLK